MMWRCLLLGFAWLGCCASLVSASGRGTALGFHRSPAFALEAPMALRQLKGHLDVYFDPTKALTLDQIRSAKWAARFRAVGPVRYNRPLRVGVVWLRVVVENRSQGVLAPWIQFRSRLIDDFRAFIPNSSGQYHRFDAGHEVALSRRAMPHPLPRFAVTFAPGERKVIYFRLSDEGTIRTGVEIGAPDAMMRKEEGRKLLWGILLGAMMLGAYLCLLLLLRLRSMLLFWFFLAFVSVVCLVLFPSDMSYSWPVHLRAWWINRLIVIFLLLGTIASLFGFASLMQLNERLPRIYRWWKWFWLPCVGVILCILTAPFLFALQLGFFVVLFPVGSLAAMALFLAWKGDRIVRLSALALVLLLCSSGLQLGRVINLVSETEMGRYISFLGMLVVIFLMSEAIVRLQRNKEREEERRMLLEKQNEELLVLDKLKDEFLANTSHELRTPLSGMIGLAESMPGAESTLDASDLRKLQLMISSGRRLSSLIDDILDFSKLRHETIQLQPTLVDLHQAVAFVLELQAPMLGAKSVVFHNEVLPDFPLLWADENRLQQVLHNLVGNAVKFTHKGSIAVRAREAGDFVDIMVEDTGVGIAEENLSRVFLSFAQGEGSIEREYGGTGLGLTVARQLISLHGGDIEVNSTLGEGSTFTIKLPLRTSLGGVDSVEASTAAHDKDVTPVRFVSVPHSFSPQALDTTGEYCVMLVDDEPINLEVLCEHLSQDSYRLVPVSSGVDAIAQIEGGLAPDLIVLDVMMPRMSGFEVCERLRRTFPASRLPILMLTAKNQTADLLHGFTVGANDYITKPFSRQELQARIRTHLGLAQFSESAARFVPFPYLDLLGKESLLDIHVGDYAALPITVLFSDIRSYTTLSEQMGALPTFSMINDYFELMEPFIRERGGFIDSYIGDAIMALFASSPQSAVEAAIAMQKRLSTFNTKRALEGQPPLLTGIGIHTGDVILGVVGSQQRHKCSVIGDCVNLASRIEGLTKYYQAPLLLSEATAQQLSDDIQVRMVDRVMVKGKTEPVDLYEVLNACPEAMMAQRLAHRDAFDEALGLVWEGAWKDAHTQLREHLSRDPDDHVARLHLARIETQLESDSPGEWGGAYQLDFK